MALQIKTSVIELLHGLNQLAFSNVTRDNYFRESDSLFLKQRGLPTSSHSHVELSILIQSLMHLYNYRTIIQIHFFANILTSHNFNHILIDSPDVKLFLFVQKNIYY